MKHLILLFVIAVGGYVAWQFASKRTRRQSVAFAKRHITPITLIAAVLFALVALAAAFPSPSIL
jgi:uncharacterized membrane protein